MKKLILFLFVALFSLGFVACKDDDNSLPIEEKIAGSYKGTLDIMMYSDGTSDGVEIAKNFPQKVYLYKVNDETIKMELKNLSVIGLVPLQLTKLWLLKTGIRILLPENKNWI